MKTLTASDGTEFMVSDEDFEYCKIFNWHNNGHALYRVIEGKHSKLHHEIAKRAGLIFSLIDHKDRDWKNNQRENLRVATVSQNGMNTRPHRDNLYSSYKGVTFDQHTKRWKAQICKNRKNQLIGRYDSEDEAALAYNNAAMILFGEFAYLNIVE